MPCAIALFGLRSGSSEEPVRSNQTGFLTLKPDYPKGTATLNLEKKRKENRKKKCSKKKVSEVAQWLNGCILTLQALAPNEY